MIPTEVDHTPSEMLTRKRSLTALAKLNQAVPGVVLGILDESLAPEKQVEFGDLLISAGEALQRHARTERVTVIENTEGGRHELKSRD